MGFSFIKGNKIFINSKYISGSSLFSCRPNQGKIDEKCLNTLSSKKNSTHFYKFYKTFNEFAPKQIHRFNCQLSKSTVSTFFSPTKIDRKNNVNAGGLRRFQRDIFHELQETPPTNEKAIILEKCKNLKNRNLKIREFIFENNEVKGTLPTELSILKNQKSQSQDTFCKRISVFVSGSFAFDYERRIAGLKSINVNII